MQQNIIEMQNGCLNAFKKVASMFCIVSLFLPDLKVTEACQTTN
jgi:hypothetical protein